MKNSKSEDTDLAALSYAVVKDRCLIVQRELPFEFN